MAGLFPVPPAGLDVASRQGCACSFLTLDTTHTPRTEWVGEDEGTLGIWLLAQSQLHPPEEGGGAHIGSDFILWAHRFTGGVSL